MNNLKMSVVIVMLVFSSFLFGAEFKESKQYTYENAWYIVYTDGEKQNVSWPLVAGGSTEKIPNTECMVGRIEHKIYSEKEDVFIRNVICFEGKKEIEQDKFKCEFDLSYKNEDGEKDETRTTCSKQYKGFRLVLDINRYLRDQVWQLKEREKLKKDTRVY